jgi:hypothetical protein
MNLKWRPLEVEMTPEEWEARWRARRERERLSRARRERRRRRAGNIALFALALFTVLYLGTHVVVSLLTH